MFMTDIIGFDSSAKVRDKTHGETEGEREEETKKTCIHTHSQCPTQLVLMAVNERTIFVIHHFIYL